MAGSDRRWFPVPAASSHSPIPLVSSAGGGDNGDATHGFDVIYGPDGSGGAGSNLALLPAADYLPPNLSHFTSQDYWFAGELDIAHHRLARPLPGRLRLVEQPAAGHLDRNFALQGAANG